MFDQSRQTELWPILESCRTGSLEVHHARTPVAPTRTERALMEKGLAYSSRQSVSSTSVDLLGHALRTFLASALEEQTGYSLRWKLTATPAGRSWWALGTPARRTSETECGSLLPTCRATDGERGGRGDLIQAIRGNTNKHFLPTPTAVSYSNNQGGAAGRHEKIRPSLASQTRGVHGLTLLLATCEWLMGYPPRLDSKCVSAYGDSVVPQITEAIARAILKVIA